MVTESQLQQFAGRVNLQFQGDRVTILQKSFSRTEYQKAKEQLDRKLAGKRVSFVSGSGVFQERIADAFQRLSNTSPQIRRQLSRTASATLRAKELGFRNIQEAREHGIVGKQPLTKISSLSPPTQKATESDIAFKFRQAEFIRGEEFKVKQSFTPEFRKQLLGEKTKQQAKQELLSTIDRGGEVEQKGGIILKPFEVKDGRTFIPVKDVGRKPTGERIIDDFSFQNIKDRVAYKFSLGGLMEANAKIQEADIRSEEVLQKQRETPISELFSEGISPDIITQSFFRGGEQLIKVVDLGKVSIIGGDKLTETDVEKAGRFVGGVGLFSVFAPLMTSTLATEKLVLPQSVSTKVLGTTRDIGVKDIRTNALFGGETSLGKEFVGRVGAISKVGKETPTILGKVTPSISITEGVIQRTGTKMTFPKGTISAQFPEQSFAGAQFSLIKRIKLPKTFRGEASIQSGAGVQIIPKTQDLISRRLKFGKVVNRIDLDIVPSTSKSATLTFGKLTKVSTISETPTQEVAKVTGFFIKKIAKKDKGFTIISPTGTKTPFLSTFQEQTLKLQTGDISKQISQISISQLPKKTLEVSKAGAISTPSAIKTITQPTQSVTTPKGIQTIGAISKDVFVQPSAFRQTQIQLASLSQSDIQASRNIQLPKSISKARVKTGQKERQVISLAQPLAQKSIQLQRQALSLAQPLRQKQIQIHRGGFSFIQPTPRIKPPTKIPLLISLGRKKEKKKRDSGLFLTQVKRKGKFETISSGLPLQKAINIGAGITAKTISQTFRVRPTRKGAVPQNIITPFGFRAPKKPKPLTFVEKRRFAISTPTEKIQLATARKQKRRKK